MLEKLKALWATKTVKVAIGGIITAIGMKISETIDWQTMVGAIFAGLGAIAMRDGQAKSQSAAEASQTASAAATEKVAALASEVMKVVGKRPELPENNPPKSN